MTNKKLIEKYEEFWFWPKQEVDYEKINDNLLFMALMSDVGFEEYMLHKC